MNFKLITFSNNLCTIGKLYDSYGGLICYTIEKPWKDNQACISCVPAGDYELNHTVSPRFGSAYCLESHSCSVSLCGNTKRTHILLHAANRESELLGCIAPVTSFGVLDGEWAGYKSGKALKKLLGILGGENHTLTIERH